MYKQPLGRLYFMVSAFLRNFENNFSAYTDLSVFANLSNLRVAMEEEEHSNEYLLITHNRHMFLVYNNSRNKDNTY